jgi:hypothetical protein
MKNDSRYNSAHPAYSRETLPLIDPKYVSYPQILYKPFTNMLIYKIKAEQNFEVIPGKLPILEISNNDNHSQKWVAKSYNY